MIQNCWKPPLERRPWLRVVWEDTQLMDRPLQFENQPPPWQLTNAARHLIIDLAAEAAERILELTWHAGCFTSCRRMTCPSARESVSQLEKHYPLPWSKRHPLRARTETETRCQLRQNPSDFEVVCIPTLATCQTYMSHSRWPLQQRPTEFWWRDLRRYHLVIRRGNAKIYHCSDHFPLPTLVTGY